MAKTMPSASVVILFLKQGGETGKIICLGEVFGAVHGL